MRKTLLAVSLCGLCFSASSFAFVQDWSKRSNQEVTTEAKRGDLFAQIELGDRYASGNGVEEDDITAVEWYRKAAAQESETAMYKLGMMYDNGHGVPYDAKEAAAWFEKASQKGSVKAQYYLAGMYKWGRGVPKSNEKAVEYYRLAAEKGFDVAQNS
ncbi:tetratricopeptide repeat protein [Vibrio variabilis]|uniref:tetratricopeptide repeat protein n=1 Tax=Vibrio variabilis TaxID=990271 RepID=UPI000DD7ABCA|nr:tetratricopeptide repeat protein [Vibrio variabilis]